MQRRGDGTWTTVCSSGEWRNSTSNSSKWMQRACLHQRAALGVLIPGPRCAQPCRLLSHTLHPPVPLDQLLATPFHLSQIESTNHPPCLLNSIPSPHRRPPRGGPAPPDHRHVPGARTRQPLPADRGQRSRQDHIAQNLGWQAHGTQGELPPPGQSNPFLSPKQTPVAETLSCQELLLTDS